MTYHLEISENLDRMFQKISKKDPLQFQILSRKIKEIAEDPNRFKPLRSNMANQRRVHIKNFVLTFEIQEDKKIVRLLDYDHHDNIYRK